MGTRKNKHHFVSGFYLEGFVDQNNPPYLWLYDKDKHSISKASSRDAGCRTLFYAFPKQDGTTDTNTLEDLLQEYESQVAPLIRKIESRGELTNEERSVLSVFLGLTLARVPNFRSMIETSKARIVKEIGVQMAQVGGFEKVKEELAKEGKPIDEELHAKMVEMMKDGKFDVEVFPHASIEHFLRLAVDMAPLFHQMHWTFLLAKGRYSFVTSDNPLAYADPTHDPKSPYGVGLGHSNVEITFPITQELALFAGWKDSGSIYQRATDATVQAVNRRTIKNAQRFIYAPFCDEGFSKLVWRLSGAFPSADLSRVPTVKSTYFVFRGMALADKTNIRQLVARPRSF
jgi:hypothetical protein